MACILRPFRRVPIEGPVTCLGGPFQGLVPRETVETNQMAP